MSDEASVDTATSHYPPPDITPAEFEEFVASVFDGAAQHVPGLKITVHETVAGVDGEYDFDATARFEVAGLAFLTLVEAKLHKNPIKRELVQVLHSKLQSVGAQKAVMVSTAPYQSGALRFAETHGIALVTVTEGRFTYETKSYNPPPAPTREQAAEWFDLPTFVAHGYTPDSNQRSVGIWALTPDRPDFLVEYLLSSLAQQGPNDADLGP